MSTAYPIQQQPGLPAMLWHLNSDLHMTPLATSHSLLQSMLQSIWACYYLDRGQRGIEKGRGGLYRAAAQSLEDLIHQMEKPIDD